MTTPAHKTGRTAHTPGPWDINPMRTVDGRYLVCSGIGHDYGVVAQVLEESDAHLIAAAPDLLKALKLARKRLEYYGQISDRRHFDHDLKEIFPVIDAALSASRSGGRS